MDSPWSAVLTDDNRRATVQVECDKDAGDAALISYIQDIDVNELRRGGDGS